MDSVRSASRITSGKRLPRSIAESLLLDQARREVETHRRLMVSSTGLNSEAECATIKKAYQRMEDAKRAYEKCSGKTLEASL